MFGEGTTKNVTCWPILNRTCNVGRDWSFAGDFAQAFLLIVDHPKPDDYVLASGVSHSVMEFCEIAFAKKGLQLSWKGSEESEEGYDQNGILRIKVNPDFYRPAEVDILCGDPTKAEKKLGWKRSYTFESLVNEMVEMDTKA